MLVRIWMVCMFFTCSLFFFQFDHAMSENLLHIVLSWYYKAHYDLVCDMMLCASCLWSQWLIIMYDQECKILASLAKISWRYTCVNHILLKPVLSCCIYVEIPCMESLLTHFDMVVCILGVPSIKFLCLLMCMLQAWPCDVIWLFPSFRSMQGQPQYVYRTFALSRPFHNGVIFSAAQHRLSAPLSCLSPFYIPRHLSPRFAPAVQQQFFHNFSFTNSQYFHRLASDFAPVKDDSIDGRISPEVISDSTQEQKILDMQARGIKWVFYALLLLSFAGRLIELCGHLHTTRPLHQSPQQHHGRGMSLATQLSPTADPPAVAKMTILGLGNDWKHGLRLYRMMLGSLGLCYLHVHLLVRHFLLMHSHFWPFRRLPDFQRQASPEQKRARPQSEPSSSRSNKSFDASLHSSGQREIYAKVCLLFNLSHLPPRDYEFMLLFFPSDLWLRMEPLW